MVKNSLNLLKRNLATQIIVGLILGIIAGVYLHAIGADPAHPLNQYYQSSITNFFKPLGDILINMIKMIVVPIVVTTLTVGIASMGDAKKIGTIGVKTIGYFEIITTIAIFVGIFAANVFKPGVGIDLNQLSQADVSQYQATLERTQNAPHGIVVMILEVIPQNFFLAMSEGKLLPIIFFSVIFGIGLVSLKPEHKDPVVSFLKGASETMFVVTNIIMRYAPIGVFGLIAVTVGQYGFSSLLPLFKLVLLVYVAMFFFVAVILGAVARICGLRMWTLCKILKDELILSFSTASSETVLPKIMEKMEAYGSPKSITGFVLPTGYSFNLDGSTLYQSIAVIFIAQIYNIDLSIAEQITIIITLMIASKGIAGVPGVSFVVLSATLTSVGLPVEGLGFILGVDRLMDMGRTVVNVLGNSLAILVIAKWENQFDTKKARQYEQEVLGMHTFN